MEEVIACLRISAPHVAVAREPGLPGSGVHLTKHEVPRLTLCISGRRHYRFMVDGRPVTVTAEPGDGLFIAPNVWLDQEMTSPYEALGVVFWEMFTQYVWVRYNPASPEPYEIDWHHVPDTLDEWGERLCSELARAPRGLERELFEKSVFELLKCEALRYLQAGQSHSKAESTWLLLRGFVEENYASSLSREKVGRALQLHPDHISRVTQRFAGTTFANYVTRVRLQRARQLLHSPELNIAEVARLSGFSDPNYFSRVFRDQFHQTPTQARGMAHKGEQPLRGATAQGGTSKGQLP